MAPFYTSRINRAVCVALEPRSKPSSADPRHLVSIQSITVTNARRKVLLTATPNSYPASRILAKPDSQDYRPVSYIQVSLRVGTIRARLLTDYSRRIQSPPPFPSSPGWTSRMNSTFVLPLPLARLPALCPPLPLLLPLPPIPISPV